jgi:predicted amidohydrolase
MYDKLHLFDVPSLNGSETYLESARVRPGSEAVLVDCSSNDVDGLGEGVRIGMSVCYDLRFPQLYRALAQAGASILTVPSAFTVVTGAAHWHALLRARAIETGCFVLAAAQVGTHPGSRKTYGHSLIVNPWGEILADAGGEGAGIIVAEIDLDEVTQARNRVPSLLHDRPFTLKTVRA